MKYPPLVSIITPSYNHAQYLEKAVKSVISQTYQNIEYIIIDDGSTDNSHQIIKKIKNDYPQVKIILHKDNKGHVRINEGIKIAKGKYISLLSSDDWYLPEKIEKQVELFEKLDDSYGVVYSGGLRYYEDLNKIIAPLTNEKMQRGYILKDLLLKPFFIYPISPLIRKKCFEEYPFSTNYTAEGEAIYFKIAMKYKFDYVNAPLVVMRDHSNNIGKNISTMLKDNIDYRVELFEHPDFPKNLKSLKNQILSKIYFLKGWEYIRIKKDYENGNVNLKKALKLNPSYICNFRVLMGIILIISPNYIQKRING